MDWNALISSFGGVGQGVILLLIVYLIWSRNRDERDRKKFQQRTDERTQQLLDWTVRTAVESAMADRKSGDD